MAKTFVAEASKVAEFRCVARGCEGGDENPEQDASSEICRDFYGPDKAECWCDPCVMGELLHGLKVEAR